jgi:peptidoglycan hydrolase-like protein with peptidoglycan-binding domain
MRERQTIRELIDEGAVASTLRRGTSARHATSALQTLLHWLGFDRQLEWDRFGADGGYGDATVAAVAEFAQRNGSTAKGERVTDVLARKILARYDSLEELKQLSDDVAAERIGRFYETGGGDRVRIASLQTLLNDLGYGAELDWARFGADGGYGRSTRRAVAAFAAREGLTGDGAQLTLPLAQRLVSRLGPFYGDNWHDLEHATAPAPGSLSVKSMMGRGNKQVLEVSDGFRRKRFRQFRRGLFTVGDQKPLAFVEARGAELRALGVTDSEINVMIAVAENEGNLDAVNTWDNAFLSFGLFQWTGGQNSAAGELPALLARIKSENRDLFDKYCGQHGLDVTDIRPADWQTSGTGPVTGRFELRGQMIRSPADKAQLRQAPWAFYFWRAGQDPAVQAMEIKHALGRLEQFYDTDACTAAGHRISALISSEYGVGLLLDNHVNRPAYVKPCLEKALARTGLVEPSGWDTAEEAQLIAAYLEIRETHGASPMTDAAKRARVTKKYLDRGVISARRGSFERSRR